MALPNGDLITTVFDPQMAYPVDKRMQVDTLNSRDSISMFIRWEGMTVYVLEDSKIYILQGGRSNEYWKELGTGSGTGGTTFVGQFPTADLLPTSGRSAGDYAFVGTGDDFVQYNWDNIGNQWVMAEGQTDMASEFFHIGYKTPLRRPVIFPLFPKDVLVQESGDFVFAPETAVARFIFTGEVTAIRGIETAEADREIKLVNRTGSDIILRDKASGIPSGSGMDFGGTDYVWVNGSEITLKGNGTYWQLAPNNQIAFSDHLDSVNAQVSVGSDGLKVISGIYNNNTGKYVTFKEVIGTPVNPIDGITLVIVNGVTYRKTDYTFSPKDYGAKGDSVTDDTFAIQSALNSMRSGDKFYLPPGEYRVSTLNISGKQNCEFYFEGTIKALDGVDFSRVVAVTSSNNCKFFNLSIDGNSGNVVDRQVLGDQPNLLLGSNQKNLTFTNTKLINAVAPGCVFNGLCENVIFDKVYLENIGEHGFYISGGSNKNCHFKDVNALNIGTNPNFDSTDDCYIFKIRKTLQGVNENLSFENITLTQVQAVPSVICVFNIISIKGMTARNIISNRPTALLSGGGDSGDGCENVHFENVTTTQLIYNVGGGVHKNITIKGGYVSPGQYSNYLNIFDTIEDVVFDRTRLVFHDVRANKPYKHEVRFLNCRSINVVNDSRHQLQYIHTDVVFDNFSCIVDDSEGAVASALMTIAQQGYTEGCEVKFTNSIIKCSTWSFSFGIYGNLTLKLDNTRIDRRLRAYSTTIKFLSVLGSVIPSDLIDLQYADRVEISNSTDINGNYIGARRSGSTSQRPLDKEIRIGFNYNNTSLGDIETWNGTEWKRVSSATETLEGKLKIASQTLIDEGINDTDAVTPLKLANSSRIVSSIGLGLTSSDGSQLIGIRKTGAIVYSNVASILPSYPTQYGDIFTFNAASTNRTYSLLKERDSNRMWVQRYNSSGVGQGWTEITVPNASTTQRGIIEQATDAEIKTGTDTERSVDPKGLKDNYLSFAERNIASTGTVAITPLNYNVKEEVITFTASGTVNLNGFNAGVDDGVKTFVNKTGNNLTCVDGAAVTVPFAEEFIIPNNQSARFRVSSNLLLKEL